MLQLQQRTITGIINKNMKKLQQNGTKATTKWYKTKTGKRHQNKNKKTGPKQQQQPQSSTKTTKQEQQNGTNTTTISKTGKQERQQQLRQR